MDRDRIYRLLYDYQKSHPGYQACCARGGKGKFSHLYRKFGNIRKLTYERWFERNRWMFEPTFQDKYWYFDPITSRRQFDRYEGSRTEFVTAVNLYAPRTALCREFKKLLAKQHPSAVGERRWDDTMTEVPISRRARPKALEDALKVYNKRKEMPNENLWRVGEEAGVCKSAHSHSEKGKIAGEKKRIMTAAVCRYLRYAGKAMRRVGEGKTFP